MKTVTRVLITGASGTLGRKLVHHLTQRGGYDLVLLDRIAATDDVIGADLSRRDADWPSAFSGVDCVVHLAAAARPNAPWSTFVTDNVDATLNVFEAALAHHVPRVVFASSLQTMFGHRENAPVGTDLPTAPINFYSASKVFGERVAKWFSEQGLSVICLRLGAVYPGENRPRGARATPDDQRTWLSDGDLCRACECAILAGEVRFGVFNVTSRAPDPLWSLTETERVLGFRPVDVVSVETLSLLGRVERRLRTWRTRWLGK